MQTVDFCEKCSMKMYMHFHFENLGTVLMFTSYKMGIFLGCFHVKIASSRPLCLQSALRPALPMMVQAYAVQMVWCHDNITVTQHVNGKVSLSIYKSSR